MNHIAIKCSNLCKTYKIGVKPHNTLRDLISNLLKSKALKEQFFALSDLNFEVEKGDVVGIIGKNGSGKSTLLKILSQITKPTSGRVEINGRVASLLEVGTGFHPELTGRENIYLNGTILGMTRREVKDKFDEIVTFSGVEKFIDTPVKHYSSGMYVRLAFAVAAHLEPEILIIDEVLAVGDAEFQKKCLGKMKDVANEGRTVLFVSHNMGSVQLLCNKGIVIENGKISFFGDVNNALDKYNSKTQENETFFNTVDYSKRKRGQKLLTISSIELDNSIYYPDSSFSIKVKIQKNDDEFRGKIDIAVFIFDELQNTVFHLGTLFEEMDLYFDNSSYYEFTIPLLSLNSGNYSIAVWLSGNGIEQDYVDQNIFFEVENGSIYPNKNANIVSMIQKEFNFLIHQRSL